MAGPNRLVGIDGYRDGWIVASVPAGRVRAKDVVLSCHPDFAEVLSAHRAADLLGVDMPLSLPSGSERRSDRLLRAHLGRRSSSLFATPCAEAAVESTWEAANATSRRLTGKGMSKQTWHLLPKVHDARAAVRACDADAPPPVYEVHPESSFVAMGKSDRLASKKSAAGIGQRLALLEADLGPLGPALAVTPPGPAIDDVLDALAICWTLQRVLADVAEWFGPAGTDKEGFPTAVPI